MSDSDLQKRVDELEAQLREAKAQQAEPSTELGDEIPPPTEPEKPEEEPTVGTGTAIALAAIAATVLLIVIGLLYVLIAALL